MTIIIPKQRISLVSTRKKIKQEQKKDLALKQPIYDLLDLRVVAGTVPTVKPFQLITRLVWYIRFPINNILFSNFGADSALTNGIQIRFNKLDLLDEPIKDLSHFPRYAYDFNLMQDATGTTKLNMLVARWSFFKLGIDGLDVSRDKRFEITINDDLSSSSNTEIHCNVEGWGYV